MSDLKDNAVGVMLTIPRTALKSIEAAERALASLHDASRKAADQIYGDFSNRMPRGIDVFIRKLAEAKERMDGLGAINVTLNTTAAVQAGQQLSSQMRKTSTDVSNVAQGISRLNIDTTSIKTIAADVESWGKTWKDVEAVIKNMEAGRKASPMEDTATQGMTNAIEKLKEYVALKKKSDEQLSRMTTPQDKEYLSEQKRLYTDLLNLRKQINEQSTKVQSGRITGSSTIKQDESDLRRLFDRYQDVYRALQRLNAEKGKDLSQAAKTQSEVNAEKYKNYVLKQQIDYRQKLNAEIIRANELTAQGQQGKTRLGSGEEAAIQRQLNSDYKNQIKILREIGEIRANAAEKSRNITEQERTLLLSLGQRYKLYADDIKRVASAYTTMGEAAAKNFAADRSEQLARNAIMLADAQNKAEGNTKQLTAEYKRLYAENQRLFESQRKYFNEGGGTPQSIATGTAPQDQAYRDMEARRQDVLQRMGEIERKNIQEVADFRLQKEMEANQKTISDFVQAEAQKKAAALQTAQEESNARKQALQAYLQSYQGAMQQADKIMSGRGGTSMFATNIENIKRAINDLKAASGNLNLLNPADVQKAEQLKNKISELGSLLKRYKDAAAPDKPVINPNDAIQAAKTATTLHELEQAYRMLKAAMASTNPNTQTFQQLNTQLRLTKQQIDQIKIKMGELNAQSHRTGSMMGSLKSQIASAFSVAAITGFLKKVTETRAQFELQNVALGAILQNKEKANEVFRDVQNMALQSPFSIMQLNTYTKQLAAYRVESDKLVGTTKMLADVSAGLGTDISRLILAFGQVKSANYLRASEVRQFTEAGLNIAEELAKYFSELQGKVVTVGDVMEMTTKRMVRFEDVEEVFKRVTSAGGMFYDMQKKQSDSISGQIQRITDAYSIMMNEIGESNEGVIKWTLTAIRNMIANWRKLAPVLKSIGGLMLAIYTGKGIWMMLQGITRATAAFVALRKGIVAAKAAADAATVSFKSLSSATVVGLGITALVTLISYLASAKSEAEALNEEMSRIGTDVTEELNESIVIFNQLADVISDSSKSYTERTEAMTELKRVYGEILPDYALEAEYIKGLQGDYTALTQIITEYYQKKEFEQKADAVRNSEEAQEVTGELKRTLERMNKEGVFKFTFPKSEIDKWATTVADELNTGKIPASLDALEARIREIFGGGSYDAYMRETKGEADFTDVLDAAEKVTEAYGNISLATLDAQNATDGLNESIKAGYTDSAETIETLTKQIETYKKAAEYGMAVTWEDGQPSLENRDFLGLSEDEIRLQEEQEAKELADLEARLEAIKQAQREFKAEQFKKEFEEQTAALKKEVQAYWDLQIQMADLEVQGQKNSDEYKELAKQQADAEESANKMAKTMGTQVPWGMVKASNTTYEFQQACDMLTRTAMPALSNAAEDTTTTIVNLFGNATTEVMNMYNRMNQIKPMFNGILPDGAASGKGWFAVVGQGGTQQIDKAAKAYSDLANKFTKQYGASMGKINKILSDEGKTPQEYAKALRESASEAEIAWEKYNISNKKAFRDVHNITEAALRQGMTDAKAMRAIADAIDPELEKGKKKGKGGKKGGSKKDEILEMWKNRLKIIQDFYKRYEELREHFDESASKTRARDAFADAIANVGLNIDEIMERGMDKKGLYKNLEWMTQAVAKVRKQLVDEYQKATADVKIQIDFEAAEKSEDEIKAEIDKMFDNYELTKQLQDISVPIELTYMVGGQPTTLDDVRKRLEELRKLGDKDAKNLIKIYEDAEKKLTDIELKEAQDRLKNYEKYLAKMYSDRAKKLIEYGTTLRQLESDFDKNISAMESRINNTDDKAEKDRLTKALETLREQKKAGVEGLQKELVESLNKLNWNDFKGSPIFEEMYRDVTVLSKKGVNSLIIQLENVREKLQQASNVDPKAVREVTQYIEKLKDAEIELNPFTAFNESLKEANKLRKQGITYESNQLALINKNDQVNNQKKLIGELESINALKDKNLEIDWEQYSIEAKELTQTKGAEIGQAHLVQLEKEKLETYEEQSKILEDRDGIFKQVTKSAEAEKKKLAEIKELANQITDSIFEMADALGGAVDDEWKNLAGSLIDATFQAISLKISLQAIAAQGPIIGASLNQALGVIGWIATGLQVIASLFTAIFAAHDKSLEKRIDGIKRNVDDLDAAFDKLSQHIDNAFKGASLKEDSQEALDNLLKQSQAYADMALLEEKKKKSDKDKVRDYRKQAQEALDEYNELKEKITEAWGGFGSDANYASAVQAFSDAWYNAFKETGDGLDALSDKWDEYIDNLIVKQMALRIVGTRMERFMKEIDKYVSEDSEQGEHLTRAELDKIRSLKDSMLGGLNMELKDLMDYFGVKGKGELILSDLQQGIQNITEPQAAAIEAYLNSMRFAVFQQTEQLNTIIDAVKNQYSGSDNPIITELRGIKSILESMNNKISSVINPSKTGRGMAVAIQ